MSKHYRIVFECYESAPEAQQILSKTVMMAGSIDKPEDVFNFGFAHEDQIKLVHSCSTKASLILHFQDLLINIGQWSIEYQVFDI